ncbi:BREX system serine/threonine kinase PglW [Tahibacter sp.]|uniref:BREX system serine/threonine kinase PglW n=1 Tax=Tahibacter sp. TaxID=2056211 RepID=UPI0028C43E67|nr:BREX system serine/threonine kinase PglW [Tahibacter sp.]
MTLSTGRWHVISESEYAWEREALEWLREHLPNHDPWHVWTNFEFIDDDGRVNEVDALVMAPTGLYLVEIKSRPGELRGDAHTWVWNTDGREFSVDNPRLLADRKAKRLASILRRQPAMTKAKTRLPFIDSAIFLSATKLQCRLEGRARVGVFLRGRPGHPEDDGVVAGLARGLRGVTGSAVDSTQMRAVFKAIAEAGIRPSSKHRTVGEYRLQKLLTEGEDYQDWLGQHQTVASVQRRIRIYTLASAQSTEVREGRIRSARREFEVLEGIDHAGMLRCRDLKETELGPALIFDHDPKAIRLDHLLHEHAARLTLTQRLSLVRGIAEVLKFAHGKRLFHRALTPKSVLVCDWPAPDLRVRLMNWQTGTRNSEDSQTLHRTTGTHHVENYVDDPGRVFLAPETAHAEVGQSAELDVFSLGALSYLILSGQPPADNPISLLTTLRAKQGLQLADVMDGCPQKLSDLIRFATQPEVLARYNTVDGFLADLDAAEDALTTPDPEATVDPSQAKAGERLEGGFTVTRHLGRGSSAVVLQVQRDGDDEALVLKVAHDAAHNEALRSEGEALAKQLRHPNIIEHRDTLSIAGRTALLLRSAGDTTLAQRIKTEGRLSLDLLQRFGEELLAAVGELENQAVSHRDIKPENIGITTARTGKLKLVLFDFSLSRTPAENIKAGTPPYLDPFLVLRSHRRWDLYAERYAAAVTLHEMAAGRPPRFGDGQSAPEVLEDEATIDSGVFEPSLRDALTAFFAKALRRDFRQRFDNAEDMQRAWRAVFERAAAATSTQGEEDSFESLAAALVPTSTVGELGYSPAALDVLSRMGINTVRELLGVDRLKFRYLQGVGDKVRKEVRLTAKRLAQLRPDLAPGQSSAYEQDDADVRADRALVAINELADVLMPRRAEQPEDAALEYYLGLDLAPERAGHWPSAGEAAGAGQISREAFSASLAKARERWLKTPAFTELRAQILTLLQTNSDVMTHRELADALLAVRGCALPEDVERLRLAGAVLRAAVEAEAGLESPRFQAWPHQPSQLIATHPAWARYAEQLGAKADGCALADPLLAPARALEALRSVPLPEAEPGSPEPIEPSATRLLRLATAASQEAALSSRQEIYRRGMPKLQALRQSLNALIGLPQIKPQELVKRVSGRYPEAEPLPAQRHLLDRLLEEVGAPLHWDSDITHGGAYTTKALGTGRTLSPISRLSRHATAQHAGQADSGELQDAQQMEQRLQHRLRDGGLLVIAIEPLRARAAQTELLHRFGGEGAEQLRLFDLDAWWLAALRQQVTALKADWNVVLRADAAPADSVDANRLRGLAQRCVPALTDALLEATQPLLVVNPGLLARFGLLHLMGMLETEVGRPGRTPALWMLLPSTHPTVASLDGATVPLIRDTNFAALPRAWVENRHRSAA